jgi:protein tyrosine/serine phosphatase
MAIPKFEKVSENLYRGGQPESLEDYQQLKGLGIKTIINLREKDFAAEEVGIAIRHQFIFSTIPMRGVSYPEVQVKRFLRMVGNPYLGPYFVHCAHGKDRTGLVVAMYRQRYEKWSKLKAWREMRKLGFNPINLGCLAYFWMN